VFVLAEVAAVAPRVESTTLVVVVPVERESLAESLGLSRQLMYLPLTRKVLVGAAPVVMEVQFPFACLPFSPWGSSCLLRILL